jgi:cell division transport system permease protein
MKRRQLLPPVTFLNAKITATVSIALVLFLLGLIVFLSVFAGNLTERIKESLSFDIVLQDHATREEIREIQIFLRGKPYARSVDYLSREEALRQLEADLGEDPAEFLGFNPLPDLLVVHLNAGYAQVDSLAVIAGELNAFSSTIKETEYRKEAVQLIGENIARIGLVLLVIALVLMFISFAIINNTIRLMIYSKRFLIYTMQLVGAKRSFIRRPFIVSNIGVGVFAACIACGLLYRLIVYMADNIPGMASLYDIRSLLIVFGSVFVLGILITIFSTALAVNRYVGANVEDLYKM